MKTLQNVLKLSAVNHDSSRETATPLTGGCNNSVEWSSFLHLTNSLCFSSARHHINKMSRGKGITQAS